MLSASQKKRDFEENRAARSQRFAQEAALGAKSAGNKRLAMPVAAQSLQQMVDHLHVSEQAQASTTQRPTSSIRDNPANASSASRPMDISRLNKVAHPSSTSSPHAVGLSSTEPVKNSVNNVESAPVQHRVINLTGVKRTSITESRAVLASKKPKMSGAEETDSLSADATMMSISPPASSCGALLQQRRTPQMHEQSRSSASKIGEKKQPLRGSAPDAHSQAIWLDRHSRRASATSGRVCTGQGKRGDGRPCVGDEGDAMDVELEDPGAAGWMPLPKRAPRHRNRESQHAAGKG